MLGIDNRKHKRYRVFLSARLEQAKELLSEHAENLSLGGLFVRGAHVLGAGREVAVRLDLPELGQFEVKARVAFVLDEDQAKESGRKPGAGLEITERPEEFDAALSEYLSRLGQRRDRAVYSDEPSIRSELESAGYRARILPEPETLSVEISRSNLPVIGIVIGTDNVGTYEHLTDATDLFRPYESADELDHILAELDERARQKVQP